MFSTTAPARAAIQIPSSTHQSGQMAVRPASRKSAPWPPPPARQGANRLRRQTDDTDGLRNKTERRPSSTRLRGVRAGAGEETHGTGAEGRRGGGWGRSVIPPPAERVSLSVGGKTWTSDVIRLYASDVTQMMWSHKGRTKVKRIDRKDDG